MANLKVKDADASDKYLAATGAGSDLDPHIVAHEVTQDTADDLKADANLQVGDVDVANGNPVPVSDAGGTLSVDDGGGTLTVDGTVTVQDGGGSVTVDGTVTADAGTGPWPVTDNGGSLTVDDGGSALAVDATGQGDVPVTLDGETVTVDGTVIADAGTGPWPVTDNGGSLTVDDGGAALSVDDNGGSLTVDGTVTAQLSPQTSGGLSIFRSIDLDESEEEVKGSAGQLFGFFLYNLASSKVYIKFYNATAASVTVGTTTPVLTIPLDADQGAVVEFTNGIAFATAITIAATTGVADSDTGAPGANEVIANVFYT